MKTCRVVDGLCQNIAWPECCGETSSKPKNPNQMTIQERAAAVLQQIDVALARSEKATPGPWTWDIEGETLRPFADLESPTRTVLAPRHDGNYGSELRSIPQDRAFIAESRTLLPASLRMLKTAIEWALNMVDNGQVGEGLLSTICDQWDSK